MLSGTLTLSCPAQWYQMVTFQSFQRSYWSNAPHFIFLTFGHSGLSARVPECQSIKKGGLDQYGAERFGRLVATIRKSVGLKRLTCGCVVCSMAAVRLRKRVFTAVLVFHGCVEFPC